MKNNITYLLGGIATALLVALILLNVINVGEMSPNKAGEFAVSYIKDNLAGPDDEITLADAKKISGIYEIDFVAEGQDVKAYVTTDGKYLFFQPYDMKPAEAQGLPTSAKPKVDLFVMSYCPYGNQAEELLMPIVDLFGNKIDAELHYILYSDYGTGYPEYCYDEENVYCSMHAMGELNQGVRELCVQENQPEKFWDFVKAANAQATYENIDELWEGIATGVGVDVAQVKTCFGGIDNILASEAELTSVPYPVQDPTAHQGAETDMIAGSPTMLINGMIFDGGRSVNDFQDAICSAFDNAPAECDVELNDVDSAAAGSCE